MPLVCYCILSLISILDNWSNNSDTDYYYFPFYSTLIGHKPLFAIPRNCSYFSVTKLCPTICDPMDCGTPGFIVLHQPLEFAQTHDHWVSDATQPSHPLSSFSLPAFKPFPVPGSFPMSQPFAYVWQSIWASASASVLEINIQGWFH